MSTNKTIHTTFMPAVIARPLNQQGITLIVSLVMLCIVLLLSTSLANMALIGEKATRNERDTLIAIHAAEAALADAEMDIENSTASNSRSDIFSPYSKEGFTDGCGKGEGNLYQGLCIAQKSEQPAAWLAADLVNRVDGINNDSVSVAFGRFTGRTMPNQEQGQSSFPAKLPRYVIELMPDHIAGHAARAMYMYRITAIGFGTDSANQVVLQSFYRKSAP